MLEKPRHVTVFMILRLNIATITSNTQFPPCVSKADIIKSKAKEMFNQKILMRETCLCFYNIEEFYQSCNFGCFWWNKKNIKPTCWTYQNLCMTFANILCFLPNFSTSWKGCVKEHWPEKSLFQNFWLNVMICDSVPKRGWNILKSLKSS